MEPRETDRSFVLKVAIVGEDGFVGMVDKIKKIVRCGHAAVVLSGLLCCC